MKRLLSYIFAAIAGLWLATVWVAGFSIQLFPYSQIFGVSLTSFWMVIGLLGLVIGILNYLAKPFLRAFPLPFETLTLELFSIVLGAGFLLGADFFFPEISIPLWLPLLYIALLIWVIELIITKIFFYE